MRESTVVNRGRAPDARELHAALAGRWRDVLPALGIDQEHLSNHHGPCPACGGRDRFRFDDKGGRGTWICSHCGAGDALALLRRVHGWTFPRACREVAQVAGVMPDVTDRQLQPARGAQSAVGPSSPPPATPTARVRELRRSAARPADVTDVVKYLKSRKLWPLPAGCQLRAHAAAKYWHDGALVGLYPALVADVLDVDGKLVTAHVTYLCNGRKLTAPYSPRKFLSRLVGRRGCAVRLVPVRGDTLGIAEGIETALAAHQLHDGIPVWSALNTSLLAKFVPPPGIHHLVIFADRDDPGTAAAQRLQNASDGRYTCEVRLPPVPAKDWADVLEARP